MAHLPKKQSLQEIDPSTLVEFALNEHQRKEFLRGVELFNNRKFWEAHESWEAVWKEREEVGRIFFQALVQAAAALHLLVEKKRIGGAMNNFEKSLSKLAVFPPHFLGIDVQRLRADLTSCQRFSVNTGEVNLSGLSTESLPKLHFSQ